MWWPGSKSVNQQVNGSKKPSKKDDSSETADSLSERPCSLEEQGPSDDSPTLRIPKPRRSDPPRQSLDVKSQTLTRLSKIKKREDSPSSALERRSDEEKISDEERDTLSLPRLASNATPPVDSSHSSSPVHAQIGTGSSPQSLSPPTSPLPSPPLERLRSCNSLDSAEAAEPLPEAVSIKAPGPRPGLTRLKPVVSRSVRPAPENHQDSTTQDQSIPEATAAVAEAPPTLSEDVPPLRRAATEKTAKRHGRQLFKDTSVPGHAKKDGASAATPSPTVVSDDAPPAEKTSKRHGRLFHRASGPLKAPPASRGPPVPGVPSDAPSINLDRIHVGGDPHVFSFEEIIKSTSNRKTLLGVGGFGSVFKGYVRDENSGTAVPIAVKILTNSEEATSEPGQKKQSSSLVPNVEDITKEVVVAARTQHQFVIPFIGYSTDRCLALVYDFMPGGDVEHLLQKCRKGEAQFPWESRVRVALGCAEALAFMHEKHIIHRDFKCGNVLLTESLEPRVADFGLVKMIPDWQSHVTTRPKGSIGYIDPMYFATGHVHLKSDVYSFGVFLVELISGKSAYRDSIHESVIPNLMEAKNIKAAMRDLLDPAFGPPQGKVGLQATVLTELARMALADQWEDRPDMKKVLEVLKKVGQAFQLESSG